MARTGSVPENVLSKRRSTRSIVARRMACRAARPRRGLPALLVLLSISVASAQGRLESIRHDVRQGPPPSSSGRSFKLPSGKGYDPRHPDRHAGDGLSPTELLCLPLAAAYVPYWCVVGATSPWWGPYQALDDSFQNPRYFVRFPYHRAPTYMVTPDWAALSLDESQPGHEADDPQADPIILDRSLRKWSARFRAERATGFGDLDRIGGHLLVSTTSRWGLDVQMDFLEETVPAGRYDQLWTGDCNLVFRFAQSERTQWRSGLGFNWLDDETATDFGVNFTYGVDFFPAQPWVLSSTIDWGTLGRVEQFRFRTTAGALIWGLETYVGYEYYDLGQTQLNSLLAGLRIWF